MKYPFYDSTRARAIIIACMGNRASRINKANANELAGAIERYKKFSIQQGLIHHWTQALEKLAIEKFGVDNAISNNSYLHCIYDNYDNARETAAQVGDVIDVAVILAAAIAGYDASNAKVATGILSAARRVDRETLECTFRGKMTRYRAARFYTSSLTDNKFFQVDEQKIIGEDEKNKGLQFASNTVISNLDYFVILPTLVDSDSTARDLQYVYKIVKSEKQKSIQYITNEEFENIRPQYKRDE